jgi:hypothetical protein
MIASLIAITAAAWLVALYGRTHWESWSVPQWYLWLSGILNATTVLYGLSLAIYFAWKYLP